jgi:hypothetical protein
MSMTQEQHLEQRAREAVAQCLIRQLIVPKVYFDVAWPDPTRHVDLLAIDRAGTGDVHAVEIKYHAQVGLDTVVALLEVPAQFRWIAYFRESATPETESALTSKEPLYPSKGMGRVGVIELVRQPNDDLVANVRVRAERFAGSVREQAAQLVAKVPADIQFD